MSDLNVLVCAHSHECGGMENHVLSLLEGLREKQVNAALAGPLDSWLADKAKAAGIPCFHIPMHGFFDAYSMYSLAKQAKAFKADILHGHSARGSHYAQIAGKLTGRPAIATAHSTSCHKHFKSAHKIIAVSQAVKRELLGKGYRDERIVVIRNGIKDPQQPMEERGRVRRELAISDDQSALCMVARFVRDKGHDLAVDMLKRLNDPCTRLVLVGKAEGPWFDHIRQRVRDAGLDNQVRFLGHREDVARILSGMDIFLAPSRREALGLSIMEGGGGGLPVIASRVGGIPEIISHGENGWLFEPENVDEMVALTRGLLGNRTQWDQLSRTAREKFQREFTLDAMLASTVALYRKVLQESL